MIYINNDMILMIVENKQIGSYEFDLNWRQSTIDWVSCLMCYIRKTGIGKIVDTSHSAFNFVEENMYLHTRMRFLRVD